MFEFKVIIKFNSDHGIDSGEMYKTMVNLWGETPDAIYIEIEDQKGEVIGFGQTGEEAS